MGINNGITSYVDGHSINGSMDYANFAPLAIDINPNSTVGSNFKDDILEYILEHFSKTPIVKHECHSCGATLEIDSKKHIFVCKYCGSTYAINTSMVNDRGEY